MTPAPSHIHRKHREPTIEEYLIESPERMRVAPAAAQHVPAVLSREEVGSVFALLEGTTRLIALLLYGSGLRLEECLTLRLEDLDFERREIRVRRGKGGKDRVTMLPEIARAGLQVHLERVRALHARDLQNGAGRVALPTALVRKAPGWAVDPAWQWVFPASCRYRDTESGEDHRHPRARDGDATGDAAGGSCGGDREACDVPYAPALVCDAPTGGRVRYPDVAGAARAYGCA